MGYFLFSSLQVFFSLIGCFYWRLTDKHVFSALQDCSKYYCWPQKYCWLDILHLSSDFSFTPFSFLEFFIFPCTLDYDLYIPQHIYLTGKIWIFLQFFDFLYSTMRFFWAVKSTSWYIRFFFIATKTGLLADIGWSVRSQNSQRTLIVFIPCITFVLFQRSAMVSYNMAFPIFLVFDYLALFFWKRWSFIFHFLNHSSFVMTLFVY